MWFKKKPDPRDALIELREKDVADLFALAQRSVAAAEGWLSMIEDLQSMVRDSQSERELLWSLVISNDSTRGRWLAVREAEEMLKAEPEWVPETRD